MTVLSSVHKLGLRHIVVEVRGLVDGPKEVAIALSLFILVHVDK